MPWGVAAAIGGAAISANSADKAAKMQGESAGLSQAEQRRQFEISRKDLAPYRDAGQQAVGKISDMLGLNRQFVSNVDRSAFVTPSGGFDDAAYNAALAREQDQQKAFDQRPMGMAAFQADPGYQFRLNEGNKAIENQARAAGNYYSPSTVMALTKYGQDFASNEFNNVFNRLSGVAGTGQTATNTSAQLGQSYAGNVGNLMTGAANARGASAISQGNIWGNSLNNAGNWYNQNQMLNKLMKNNNFTPNYYGTGNVNTMNAEDSASWWGGP